MTRTEKQARDLFTKAVLAKGGCILDWVQGMPCNGECDAHHVIPKQRLRQLPYRSDLERIEIVWDPRNGVPVCRAHHFALSVGAWRFTPDRLPPEVGEFARDHDIEWALEREVVGYEPG